MIISPKHKFILFKPMKTAGSSVEKALFPFLSEEALCSGGVDSYSQTVEYPDLNNEFKEGGYIYTRFHQHTSPSFFYKTIKNSNIFDHYKKITIVRNPWEVCLSYYWYNLALSEKDPTLVKSAHKIKPGMSKSKVRKIVSKYFSHHALIINQDSMLDKDPILETTPLDFLANTNESFVNDTISCYLRHENLSSDFESLCKELDITPVPELPRLKSVKKPIKRHYSWFFDNYTKTLVEKAFPKTIEKFGYKFERRSSK